MPKSVRCRCRGELECKLCRGMKVYDYEPGPRGWQLFPCPTCRDARTSGRRPACATCDGRGVVDPADPPPAGGWRGRTRAAWIALFGG